jgi:acetyl-CoA carboxylase carboxyl transferase subunit alpha
MLEFERSVAELKDRIEGLKTLPGNSQLKIQEEIQKLEKKSDKLLYELYQSLTPWQKVLVARHPERPKTQDYIARLMDHFVPLSGDRCFSEDVAITGGLASLRGIPVLVMGHEKGHDTTTRVKHNFGMAHPEGYRKAKRLMELAHRFKLPIITFVDTPGAYAGTQAEERGQAQAIAECIEMSLIVDVPLLSVIIGEGGSGGAVAFATANYIAMLEHSVYSVISPEGCASILWRTADKKEEAAAAQKLTAQDLLKFGIIDEVIGEPLGGAHRNRLVAMDHIGDALYAQLQLCQHQSHFAQMRRQKFLTMGKDFLKPH